MDKSLIESFLKNYKEADQVQPMPAAIPVAQPAPAPIPAPQPVPVQPEVQATPQVPVQPQSPTVPVPAVPVATNPQAAITESFQKIFNTTKQH